jgi:preprotein translocase subunit SecD
MMYAMIRHYRMGVGSIDDLMHKVDTQFADRLREQLSIIQYLAIDTGGGTIMTITVFEDEEAGHRSEAVAAQVRESLGEFQVEEISVFRGEVMVSRATEEVLNPVHH